jgi:phospholipase C
MVTQLMLSRYWASSAFMWSYDGSGGWYDGVRPPVMGSATLGFRAPALLVSPYARRGQVNHTVLDYTGALKFIEQNWRLAPLAARDAHSNSLTSALNFAAGPRPPVLLHGTTPDPLPVTRPLSDRLLALIYVLYGGAAAVIVLVVAFVAWRSARSQRRRPPAPAARATTTEEAGG